MIASMMLTVALAGSPQGTFTTDAGVVVGFRPGLTSQATYGIWKGFFVGGRLITQQEAYWAASNLGEFTETGTWHHGAQIGGGVRATLGRRDQWDLEFALFVGPELSFVRESVRYVNSGQEPPYEVRDQRFYTSVQAGLMALPLPTVRYRFAKNHGIVVQPVYPISQLSAIERAYVVVGWTARFGGDG